MENDDEVPAHLDPKTTDEREFYYLLIKRNRTVSDVETLNHMYGAVQAMGNLDVDTMDRYQAAKRKGTKIIQKCNELLDALKAQVSFGEPKVSPKEEVPRESPQKKETTEKKVVVPTLKGDSQMTPKDKPKNPKAKNQKEGPIGTKGISNIHPDGGEQERERREALETVWQLTNGQEETSPTRNNRDYAFDTRRENGFTGTGWSRLETPGGQFDPRGRDLSWDYSDATMSYEGSYLVATSGPDTNTVVTRRGKTKRNRCRYKANCTQTPYGNKTAVSVDKETQMTSRKANTPIREGISEGINGSIIQTTKTGSKKKKKYKLFEYDKVRLYPAVPGLTEEEMLRRGPTCKDCKKGHYGQVCSCNKCGWIHPHHGCPERPFTPEYIPIIIEVPPEGVEPKKIKLTLPIERMEWCWLCGSHGPKEICPRRDEIDNEFGHQRLKELLQQMIKAEGKLGKGTEINDQIPGVEEEINFLGTPPFPVPDKKPVGPQLIQPPEGKKPHIKPI